MGTNFYLVRKKPMRLYDTYHIGKRSLGWKPLFQTSDDSYSETVIQLNDGHFSWDNAFSAPSFYSVNDIKNLVDSGEYFIIDEYGAPRLLSDLTSWEDDINNRSHDPSFHDPQGYEFCRTYFG